MLGNIANFIIFILPIHDNGGRTIVLIDWLFDIKLGGRLPVKIAERLGVRVMPR